MKFIGLTGGVGAGKTTVIKAIRELVPARILIADEIAHALMKPGTPCYERLYREFSDAEPGVFCENGDFDRERLAALLFSDEEKRSLLNGIVHPAVKEFIVGEAEKERRRGAYEYVIVEAALLIEEGYDAICDELWYVYASPQTRRQRLMADRGYSGQKIEQMFAAQLPEETYRSYCRVVIDNNQDEAHLRGRLKQLFQADRGRDCHDRENNRSEEKRHGGNTEDGQ